jgi:hypothetical protein
LVKLLEYFLDLSVLPYCFAQFVARSHNWSDVRSSKLPNPNGSGFGPGGTLPEEVLKYHQERDNIQTAAPQIKTAMPLREENERHGSKDIPVPAFGNKNIFRYFCRYGADIPKLETINHKLNTSGLCSY